MVLVQLPTVLLRVNQSKVRRDHDEWHDVQIPHLEGPSSENKSGSSNFTTKKCLQQSTAWKNWSDMIRPLLSYMPSLQKTFLCVRNSGASVLMLLDGKPKGGSTVW